MFTILLPFIGLMAWLLYCNNKTFKFMMRGTENLFNDRRKRIEHNQPLDEHQLGALQRLEYGRVLWYTVTCRDPIHIVPPNIQQYFRG